jgi:hypothetical protein
MADQPVATVPVVPNTAKPDFNLIVIHQFGVYTRGSQIFDPAQIAAVMASENAHFCRKTLPQ